MKSRLGKITLGLMLLIIATIGVILITASIAQAATTPSHTFVLPSSSTVTHTANTYIIIWDRRTGNLVADAGTVAAANGWTDGDIATAVHAQNGTVWLATIPALDGIYQYALAVYDAASPAKTDVPTMGPFLYDPAARTVFTDTNPINGNRTRTINN